MTRRISLGLSVLSVLMLSAMSLQAQQPGGTPDAPVGTWSGSWEGAGAGGGFDLILEKGKEGTPAGGVNITGEPAYKATFKKLAIAGQKLTGTYDFPPDESIEVTITATFDGQKVTGTWTAVQKGGGEVASGTWNATKK